MLIPRLLAVALILLSNGLYTFAADQDVLTSDLLEWLRANGAYINEKLVVRHLVPNDPSSPRGVFTTENVDAGETVCFIPPDLILKSTEEYMKGIQKEMSYCGTIKAVVEAMDSDGDNNTPYGRYLLSQPKGYTAKFWSDAGKNLLSKVLRSDRIHELTEYDELPPHGVNDILEELEKECNGDIEDPLYLHAAMVVSARADYEFMVPFYDMFNHDTRNYNVKHKFDHYKSNNIDKDGYEMVADKIEAGSELLNSYNRCNICDTYFDWFGTPEMFLNFGFVESMPQSWLFDFARVKFDLDWKDADETTGEVVANFLVPPSMKGLRLLQEELTRLESFHTMYRDKKYDVAGIPKNELDSIWQYYDALCAALTIAIQSGVAFRDDGELNVWSQDDNWWVKDGPLKAADVNEHYVLPTKRGKKKKTSHLEL